MAEIVNIQNKNTDNFPSTKKREMRKPAANAKIVDIFFI